MIGKKSLGWILLYLLGIVACTHQEKGGQSTEAKKNKHQESDWVGVYRGVLPCADCEGVVTMIHLKKDLTYVKSMQYTGKSSELFTQYGSFQWNREGNILTLMPWEKEEINEESKAKESVKEMYQLGENQLIQLDKEGKRIKGPLEHNAILIKQDFDKDIREKYWKLIELKGKAIAVNENQKREAHLVLRTKDQRVTGHGGCNAFGGNYLLSEGNRVKFSSLMSTEMFCAEMEYETEFLNVLQTCDNYTIAGDTLSLNKARMAPLAKLVAVYFR